MSIRLPDPFVTAGAPGFTVGDLDDNYPLIQDELQDGSVLQIKNGNQYWGINIAYPDLLPSEYGVVISSIEEAKRLGTYIDILLPQYSPFRVTGDVSAIGIAAAQNGTSLVLQGTNALSGQPLPGDIFQMTGSSAKVYRITSVNTSVFGQWTLGLYPDLVITTTGAETPVFNSILFRTVLQDWNTKSSISLDGLYQSVSYAFREAK